MIDRGRRRRLLMGLQTVLGLKRAGFFVPHRHAARAHAAARRSSHALETLFAARADDFRAFLDEIDGLGEALLAISGLSPPEPRFEQDWFPRLDAAALYALVRTRRPARIVEVGSGHSTRFVMRALRDGALSAAVTAIDPAPRADLAGLPIDLVRAPLQDVDLSLFADLSPGDLLTVDSSHVLMPGTDVDILLGHVLPAVPPGLVVAFHDVFLPDPYPDRWPFSAYNEQNGVAALLAGGWRPLFSSRYATTRMAERVAASVAARLPIRDGASEGLLVLERVGP